MNQITLGFVEELKQLSTREYQLKRMIANDMFHLIMSRIKDHTRAEVMLPFDSYLTKEERDLLPDNSLWSDISCYIEVLFEESNFKIVCDYDCE